MLITNESIVLLKKLDLKSHHEISEIVLNSLLYNDSYKSIENNKFSKKQINKLKKIIESKYYNQINDNFRITIYWKCTIYRRYRIKSTLYSTREDIRNIKAISKKYKLLRDYNDYKKIKSLKSIK